MWSTRSIEPRSIGNEVGSLFIAEAPNHDNIGINCALSQRNDLSVFRRIVPLLRPTDRWEFHEHGAYVRPRASSCLMVRFNRHPPPIVLLQYRPYLLRVLIECFLIKNLLDCYHEVCHLASASQACADSLWQEKSDKQIKTAPRRSRVNI